MQALFGDTSTTCEMEEKASKNWNSHSVTPVDDFVLVARDLEALSLFLISDNSNIGQPLLSCTPSNAYSRNCRKSMELYGFHLQHDASVPTGCLTLCDIANAVGLRDAHETIQSDTLAFRQARCIAKLILAQRRHLSCGQDELRLIWGAQHSGTSRGC